MSAAVRIQSKSANVWFNGLPEKLEEAARNYQLSETPDWQTLDELSEGTRFEGMEAYGESAVVENGENIAPGRVHVELVYDEPGETLTFRDSFPARVIFEVDRSNETVKITRVEADTSSFFSD
jgi:Predicted pPIWI-associating nuclease